MPSHLASTATVSTPLSRTALLMPALLLFISGATAQIYQVLWIKQLSLVIGVEVHAITTGISAFFAGLALGGLLFGRFADRLGKPLLLYAGLEIGVAVLGIGATLGLSLAAAPFAWLEQQVGLLAGLLPLLLVGLPALLMGGTLPVLVRALANAAHDPGIQVRLRDGRLELLRSEQPGVRNALQDVGVASGAVLLATFVTDRAGLERFAAMRQR